MFVIFEVVAGGTLPWPSAFWSTIGPYLPPGAGTTAVRNTIYFDGNGIGRSLVVLAIYLVVGGVVLLRVRREPASNAATTAGDVESVGASAVVV